MCGIVGSLNHSGKYASGMERAMRDLIWADTLRGSDATGLFVVQKDLVTDWGKMCADGWTYIHQNTHAKKILRDAENHPVIIAHNRAATLGSADDVKFAHPIVIPKKLALVHNGTLSSWPGRYDYTKGTKRVEHDSTAIAQIIAEAGPHEFVDKCYGAYSLVWYDEEKQTTNFLRNEDRPMAMVHTENVMFFGSELGMVMWCIQRNNFKPAKYFNTEPGKLYTFEIGESEPKIVDCKKKVYSSPGRRFPEREGGFADYGWPRRHSPYDVHGIHRGYGYNDRPTHHPYDDDDGVGTIYGEYHERSELARSRLEAERLAKDSAKRDEEIAKEEKEDSSTSGKGSGKQGKVIPIRGKPHGIALTEYKTFKQGDPVLFSCVHYGEMKDHGNGLQYNVYGIPATAIDFPEIQVRGVLKADVLPQDKLQKSKKYLTGKVNHIFRPMDTSSRTVMIFVTDVKESGTDDPGLKVAKSKNVAIVDASGESILPESMNEVAEVVIHATKNPGLKESPKSSVIEGKQKCQGAGCGALFSSPKLRLVTETWAGVGPKSTNSTVLRLCEDCVIRYADDRSRVVPEKMKSIKPDSSAIRMFH